MSISVGWVLVTEGELMPTPTPRATRAPTPAPQTAVNPAGPTSGTQPAPAQPPAQPQAPAPTPATNGFDSSAYNRLVGFVDSSQTAYGSASSALIELSYYAGCGPGATVDQCAATRAEGALIMETPVRLLRAHLAYMNSNSAHPCFADAYEASRTLAGRYLEWFETWSAAGRDTPEGLAQGYVADEILGATSTFWTTDYYSDCS